MDERSGISVHTDDSKQITRVKEIFTQAGAQDICTTGETATPKKSKASQVAYSQAHL